MVFASFLRLASEGKGKHFPAPRVPNAPAFAVPGFNATVPPPDYKPGISAPLPRPKVSKQAFFETMPGMTMKSLKSKYSLVPLFVIIGAGMSVAAFYLIRITTKGPEVVWRKWKKDEPWAKEELFTHQYKFMSPRIDYAKLKPPAERPDIKS